MNSFERIVGAIFTGSLFIAGCGTPGAPLPPSLNLPAPVEDLSASRAGSQVALTWTMPTRNTDKLLLKGNVDVRLCRKENAVAACVAVGPDLSFAPAADAAFTDSMPAALANGAPRPLSYFVELRNRNGRSAGLSNAAVVLAGEAPPPVSNLTAELRKRGVVLHWNSAIESNPASLRLHRKLLTLPASKTHEGLLAPPPEPVEQSLLIDPCAPDKQSGLCSAVDQTIRPGQSYEYRAQRVAHVAVEGKTLELAGELSAPVHIEARDIFPPDVPTNLAAIATTGQGAVGEHGSAIDLSWQTVTDADLAGYIVYRREGDSAWQRISPPEPLVPPAFHDTQIQPGHSYRYSVSAIGHNGHESARSAESEESVPNP
jgi:hypothetical protein